MVFLFGPRVSSMREWPAKLHRLRLTESPKPLEFAPIKPQNAAATLSGWIPTRRRFAVGFAKPKARPSTRAQRDCSSMRPRPLRQPSPGRFLLAVCLLAIASSVVRGQSSDAPPPPPVPAAPGNDETARVEPVEASDADEPKPGVDRGTISRLFWTANPMLWPLAACSILTLGVALERFSAIRRKRVVPPEFVDRFMERLAAGKLDRDRAIELCKAHDSPAARVFTHIVKAWGQPGAAIRQVVAFDASGEVVELRRNLRVLSGMATLGPLLGLLGTVVGIIQSFDALGGRAGPDKGEALAQGISLALLATAFGLVIAVVAVSAYYYLHNRLDALVRELDDHAREVIDMVSSDAAFPPSADRRGAAVAAPTPIPAPPPPPDPSWTAEPRTF